MDWHIYGVIETDNFSLLEKYKKELLGIIGDNHPKKENFLKEIEDAIGRAKGVQNLRGSQKPSEIRKNLKKLNKSMRKTIISLSNLDPYSKQLIEEHTKSLETLVEYEKNISIAIEIANQLPQKGNLYQGHERYLAFSVAAAINDILGEKPTLTHNEISPYKNRTDIYAQCLSISLGAASFIRTSQEPQSIFNLMKQGITTLESRETQGGLTTFRQDSI